VRECFAGAIQQSFPVDIACKFETAGSLSCVNTSDHDLFDTTSQRAGSGREKLSDAARRARGEARSSNPREACAKGLRSFAAGAFYSGTPTCPQGFATKIGLNYKIGV
jgi:hypothetical protein